MHFSLTNAPTTFQSCMNITFNNQLHKFVLKKIYAILIYSKKWEENLHHMEAIQNILAKQPIYTKLSKWEFGMTEMLYLGHVIGQDGFKVHMEKI